MSPIKVHYFSSRIPYPAVCIPSAYTTQTPVICVLSFIPDQWFLNFFIWRALPDLK